MISGNRIGFLSGSGSGFDYEISREDNFVTAPEMSKNSFYGGIDLPGSVLQKVSLGIHDLLLKKDGTVWTQSFRDYWSEGLVGWNYSGAHYNTDLRQVSGIDRIIDIDASTRYSLALREDGSVWTWGDLDKQRSRIYDEDLGLLERSIYQTIDSVPVRIDGLSNIKEVAAGFNTGAALDNNGNVWDWGYEQNRSRVKLYYVVGDWDGAQFVLDQVGAMGFSWGSAVMKGISKLLDLIPGATSEMRVEIECILDKTPLQRMTDVKDITAKHKAIAALKNDGTVWIWKHDSYDVRHIPYTMQLLTPRGWNPAQYQLIPDTNLCSEGEWNLLEEPAFVEPQTLVSII
ncbi:MAG: hypothetical protein CVU87_09780 [Firmicutes bacterium HGW-Firmicutes-12]|nr:MAG: hypothetical protein CVU87_09780 [Firmicutes bacterium HGW-Firmicutes-12]